MLWVVSVGNMVVVKFGKGCVSRMVFIWLVGKRYFYFDWLEYIVCDCWIRRIYVRENLKVSDYKICNNIFEVYI